MTRKSYTIKEKISYAEKAIKMQKNGLHITESAELFGIPNTTLQKWIKHHKNGEYDGCNVDHKRVFRPVEIEKQDQDELTHDDILKRIESKINKLLEVWR